MEKRYIYGRVRVYGAGKYFLLPAFDVGDFDLVVKTYASNAEEAGDMLRAARELANQLNYVADDLERFVEIYDFTNDDVVAADNAARLALGEEGIEVD